MSSRPTSRDLEEEFPEWVGRMGSTASAPRPSLSPPVRRTSYESTLIGMDSHSSKYLLKRRSCDLTGAISSNGRSDRAASSGSDLTAPTPRRLSGTVVLRPLATPRRGSGTTTTGSISSTVASSSRHQSADFRSRADSKESNASTRSEPPKATRPSLTGETTNRLFLWEEVDETEGSLASPRPPPEDDDTEVDFRDIVMDDPGSSVLGEGFFGVVKSGTFHRQRVAVKFLKAPSKDFMHSELKALRSLHHKNLVTFLGMDPARGAFVMELMEGGDLCDLLHNETRLPLSLGIRTKIAFDVASGLLFLKLKRFMHRDLTSSNVLLCESPRTWSEFAILNRDAAIAKVTDFGMARRGDRYSSRNTGNLYYLAPEALLKSEYSTASDVYAFGILLHELFSRTRPFSELAPMEAATSAARTGIRPRLDAGEPIPLEMWDLMERCWDEAVYHRPSLEEIVERLGRQLPHAAQPARRLFVWTTHPQEHEVIAKTLELHGQTVALPRPSMDSVLVRRAVGEADAVVLHLPDSAALSDEWTRLTLAQACIQRKPFVLLVSKSKLLEKYKDEMNDVVFKALLEGTAQRCRRLGTLWKWKVGADKEIQEGITRAAVRVLQSLLEEEKGATWSLTKEERRNESALIQAAVDYVERYDLL